MQSKFKIIIPPPDIATRPGLQQQLAAGCHDAFTWVYKNYGGKLYEYSLLLTDCPTQSEDLVQETFLKLWVNKEAVAGIKNFNGWIFTIARNCILDHRRKQLLRTTEIIADYQDTDILPSQLLEHRQQQARVGQVISNLPFRQRQVWELCKEVGWKRKKVAANLSITPGTVKMHMDEARRKIKQAFV
jgi:RNA polymerase sigma factor (sigma-70 family)